jgi:hypothetical protein
VNFENAYDLRHERCTTWARIHSDYRKSFMLEILICQMQAEPIRLIEKPLGHRAIALAAMVLFSVIGLTAIGLIYYRRLRLQSSVESQFKTFRERAVALMDELDGLRQRHKTLPKTDPDFTVAMTGATLALYDRVNHDLDRLWERWLKVMEIWEQAQWRIRAGSGLGVKPTEEAQKLLAGGEIDELVRQSSSCKARLDQLNEGHERAREELKAARLELAAIQSAITKGTGVLLPSDPNHGEVAAAEEALSSAEHMIQADPIGARELISRTRRALAALSGRPDGRTPDRGERQTSYVLIDELAAAGQRLRAAFAKLRLTDLLGLFVRAWVAVWMVGILLSLLTALMPLIIFAAGFLIILAGGWMFWRAVAPWFWIGSGR